MRSQDSAVREGEGKGKGKVENKERKSIISEVLDKVR